MLPHMASDPAVADETAIAVTTGLTSLARRLTPLAWAFVVLAALDLAQRLLWSFPVPDLTWGLTWVARAVTHGLLVALPAAVLAADPDGWRTRRLVLVGALTIAGAELVSLAVAVYRATILSPDAPATERLAGEALGDLLRFVLVLASVVGPALLGAGLARRYRGRVGGPSWRPAPVTLAILLVGATTTALQILQVLGESGPVHRLEVVTGAMAAFHALAWAYVAAVTLPDSGIIGAERRPRMALAAGALSTVAAGLVSTLLIAMLDRAVEVPAAALTLPPLLSALGVILLICGLATSAPDPRARPTAGRAATPSRA